MKFFRFGQPQAPAVTHTSGFAEVADGETPSFGSVSPETFEQRKHVDRNRQHVAKFREAEIHRDYRKHRQRPQFIQSAHEPVKPDPQIAKRELSQQPVVRPAPNYQEPHSRGFNPFR